MRVIKLSSSSFIIYREYEKKFKMALGDVRTPDASLSGLAKAHKINKVDKKEVGEHNPFLSFNGCIFMILYTL